LSVSEPERTRNQQAIRATTEVRDKERLPVVRRAASGQPSPVAAPKVQEELPAGLKAGRRRTAG
jgi:hypothetical protein